MVDTGQQDVFAAAPCGLAPADTTDSMPACPEEASTDVKRASETCIKAFDSSSSTTMQLEQPNDQGQLHPAAPNVESAADAGPDSKPQDPSAAVYRLKIVGIPAGELRLSRALPSREACCPNCCCLLWFLLSQVCIS
jgi:hypothetical protein